MEHEQGLFGFNAMFVPDYLKSNAYRVLRLSAKATPSEIHKAAASMRRAAALGLTGTTEADMPLLGEVPRTEADIRMAVGRMDNPVQRLSDRLFWFYLTPALLDDKTVSRLVERFQGNPEAVAALDHDKALHATFDALKGGVDDAGIETWIRAIRGWHRVMSDDSYWSLVLALEERGGFEPAALPSEIDALRHDAVRLAAEALLVAARDALTRNDTSTVRRILGALRLVAETGPWAAHAQSDIAAPALEHFRKMCGTFREECSPKIVREPDAGKRNKSVCDAALNRFRTEIKPEFDRMIQLVTVDHEVATQVREEAARCLCGIAVDYTWADDFVASEKLHEEALEIARDTVSAVRIEHGLAQVRGGAARQRVLGALTPISSAPLLFTLNGVGFTVYGRSDYDEDTRSYGMTHYFVVLFIPVLPIGRYRVIDAGGGKYSFIGRLPLRTADRWHLGIVAAAILALILGGVVNSGQNPAPRSAVPATSYVPSSRTSQISSLKTQIESGRSRLQTLKTQLQPVTDELSRLSAQLEKLAADLRSFDEKQRAGLRIDVNDYNAKVDLHNAILSKHRTLLSANRADLKAYDDLIAQDSALVDQYNALLKR